MLNRPFILTMIILLICAYGGALAVSSAHLTVVFQLFNKGLPDFVSLDLAIALEVVAFLFSLISTSLGKEIGPSAARGAAAALLLVWSGTGYAMWLAAPSQPWYVTFGASCFVPVCTLMVGKVLGSLFGLLDRLTQEKAEREAALNRRQQSRLDTTDRPLVLEPQNPLPAPTTPSVPDINPTETAHTTDPEASPATSEAPRVSGQHLRIEALAPISLNLTAAVVVPPTPTEPPVQFPRPISTSTGIRGSTSGAEHETVLDVKPDRTETEVSSRTPHPDPDTRQRLQRQHPKANKAPVPESYPVPESHPVPETPGPAKANPVGPRKVKPDLTGVRALADQALSDQSLADQPEADQVLFNRALRQAGISWAELDGLARLVKDGWPPTATPRLLSARQGVLVWAFVGAKASKTGLAAELDLGKREWVVRDVAKSVEAVLEAVSRSYVVNSAAEKTPHVHVSGRLEKCPEAAAGGDFFLLDSEVPMSTSSSGSVKA